MRQKAVSSAPQNEAPIHSEAAMAAMPTVVEDSRTRRSTSSRVDSASLGKTCWRSATTEVSTSGLESTWPAM